MENGAKVKAQAVAQKAAAFALFAEAGGVFPRRQSSKAGPLPGTNSVCTFVSGIAAPFSVLFLPGAALFTAVLAFSVFCFAVLLCDDWCAFSTPDFPLFTYTPFCSLPGFSSSPF